MEQRGEDSPMEKIGLLTSVIRNLRLAWRLVRDGRVPLWAKSVLAMGVVYIVFPLDFVPDYVLGLGQLDDVGVALLCFKLFLSLCPPGMVQEHLRQMDAVEAEYRVVEDCGQDEDSRA